MMGGIYAPEVEPMRIIVGFTLLMKLRLAVAETATSRACCGIQTTYVDDTKKKAEDNQCLAGTPVVPVHKIRLVIYNMRDTLHASRDTSDES